MCGRYPTRPRITFTRHHRGSLQAGYDAREPPPPHERNDEVLERIYIGRRFKNDTERLEKLFELYTKMTTEVVK